MKTEREVQMRSAGAGRGGAGLPGHSVCCPLTVLTERMPTGTAGRRKDVLASLRPQSGPHGFRAGMGRESLYVYIVDVQIANLDIGREQIPNENRKEWFN